MAAFVLGVCGQIVGSTCESFGLQVQKLSHRGIASASSPVSGLEEGELDDTLDTQAGGDAAGGRRRCLPAKFGFLGDCQWVQGFAIWKGGKFLEMLTLAFVPESVAGPLLTWALAVNTATAPRMLGERRRAIDVLIVAVIVTGMVLTVLGSGEPVDPEYTVDEVLKLMTSFGSLCYLGGIMASAAVLRGLIGLSPSRFRLLWPFLAATMASLDLLFSKANSELLKAFTKHFEFPVQLIFFIAVPHITAKLLEILFVNRSLAVNDALYHIPIFFVTYDLFSIGSGYVVWREFDHVRGTDLLLFAAGVALLLVGVIMVGWRGATGESKEVLFH